MHNSELAWSDYFKSFFEFFDEVGSLVLGVYEKWPFLLHDLIHNHSVIDGLRIIWQAAVFPAFDNNFIRVN